jgi:hypothetical protein
MIIANSMQLPEAFLRHKVESTAQAAFDEDEGVFLMLSNRC